ncbi:molybdopterin-guanine dinucleotide biosynthesis protein B [Sneathiella marina]|uniref:Molybdopterin-guanine dinucleotide biosynthesis protein B n=1 Tax=Sneathiella marina TaxID=2950108 RepID=A0ABY4W617_9PROT|nr:molybdopterin-guanine dinucleotide biosynthesis protein B [Sneathiella marina]USG62379.1 molybdopterin-guanine dinucleotide biosynthesis protein B [Sneathiella marina]
MNILGISGWSGNGKTTLLTRLIPALIQRGHTVSTIKHAHHKFDIDRPGKDSFRHREAGAHEVLISSANRWALMHENLDEGEAHLEQLIEKMVPVDLLLIEGFKTEDFPKIEVWREESGTTPRMGLDGTIIAIACPNGELEASIPVLNLNDENEIADFIVSHFQMEVALDAPAS